jgi:hypothetical protein
MSLVRKIVSLFRGEGNRRYREGWVFTGDRVVLDDMLCQSADPEKDEKPEGRLLPETGSAWWYSKSCGEHIHMSRIFDSKQAASACAVQHLAAEIDRLTKVRNALLDSIAAAR